MTKHTLIAFAAALPLFAALDAAWLALVAADAYRDALGPALLERPRLGPAGLFYLLYAGGIAGLAIRRAPSAAAAATRGGGLGLVAYGTYDLSNLATLEAFTWEIALLDMAWGTAGTALTAAGAWLAARRLTGHRT